MHKTITSRQLLPAAVAAALSVFALGASAADVEVYGLVDLGMKATKASGESSLFEMNSGQISGSRFGLRAKETISPDLKVFFNLENGFDADTGEMADTEKLFNRNAVLGLETRYGEIEFGRTGALVAGVTGGIFAGRVSPFGITWQEGQSSQLLSGAVATRMDNTIRYESPRMAGWQLYAQFSNGTAGDDAVPSAEKVRYGAVGATYRKGPFMAVAVVDRMFNKNRSDGTSDYLGDDYSTFNFGGTYDLGPVKVFAAYQYGDGVTRVGKLSSTVRGSYSATNERNRTGFDTHAFLLGADVDLWGGTLKLAGGYAFGDRNWRQYRSSNGSLQYTYDQDVEGYQAAIGYLYPLSKRTDVYAGAALVHAKDTTDGTQWRANGTVMGSDDSGENTSTRSFIMGLRHRF